jgi:Uma2 family endonuclease
MIQAGIVKATAFAFRLAPLCEIMELRQTSGLTRGYRGMSTVIRAASPAEVEYPDSDGEPMAENTLQFDWIVKIKEGLEAVFRRDPNVFVAGDLLWYPVEGDPDVRCAPDAMVAFGRPTGRRGSYKQWEEGNTPPQVVFEVLSPGNRAGKMQSKFEFYERYGVEEYYIYDPDDGFLRGWVRRNDRLEPVSRMEGFVSPLLGIRFQPGAGPANLTIFGPDGQPFQMPVELVEDLESAVRRAEEERQRADAERAHAHEERQRADAERAHAHEERQRADAERAHAHEERQRADAEGERAAEQARIALAERQRADAERNRADAYAAKLRKLGIQPD